MCGAVSARAASLARRACVPLVGLNPLAAGWCTGREVRIGDDHPMAESVEVSGAPLVLCLR